MKLHDISLPISEGMIVWPGDPAVSLERARSIDRGDGCNVTRLAMGAHAGTHIDAPYHFINSGRSVDDIPVEILIGPCRVVEHEPPRHIDVSDVAKIDYGNHKRILFKTKNSSILADNACSTKFEEDFIALKESAARYLAEKEFILVGIDYLSIEAYAAEGHPVHDILLGSNIVILEGLNLSGVRPGDYELICLPLRLAGADGAPARVILREI